MNDYDRKSRKSARTARAELERFVKIASEELDARQFILFGSLARDRASASQWTDLDLVVIAETDLPFHRRIGELLEKARFKVGADVFVYTPAEWELMKAERPFIREEVVYDRTGQQVARFCRRGSADGRVGPRRG